MDRPFMKEKTIIIPIKSTNSFENIIKQLKKPLTKIVDDYEKGNNKYNWFLSVELQDAFLEKIEIYKDGTLTFVTGS